MQNDGQILAIEIEDGLYAVPIKAVREILNVRPITKVPNSPDYLLGMIDVRGDTIPVADMRKLMGYHDCADNPETRILVASMMIGDVQRTMGLRCDKVTEVTSLDEGGIKPFSAGALLNWPVSAIAGIGRCHDRAITILNLDGVFSNKNPTFL